MSAPEIPKTRRLTDSETVLRFRDYVRQFPDNELYRFSLGKALFDSGTYGEAIEHLETALAKRPDWMVVCILLGRAAVAVGEVERARGYFVKALVLAVAEGHEQSRTEIIGLMETLG